MHLLHSMVLTLSSSSVTCLLLVCSVSLLTRLFPSTITYSIWLGIAPTLEAKGHSLTAVAIQSTHIFFLSQIDYCNCILIDLLDIPMNCQQSVMNINCLSNILLLLEWSSDTKFTGFQLMNATNSWMSPSGDVCSVTKPWITPSA